MVYFTFPLFSLLTQWVDFDYLFLHWAIPLHEICRQFSPHGPWRPAYEALVCGASLPASEFSLALQRTSLLHLAIVSGSHLVLLEVILLRLLPGRLKLTSVVFLLLTLYALFSGWQPPAVRALASVFIQALSVRHKFFWTPLQTTWLSGLLTASLFPSWIHSFSFLLSWGAALGLSLLPTSPSSFAQSWKTHSIVFITLFPLLLPLTPPHPLTVLCNWLVGPALGILLFPMSLACFALPFLTPWVDYVWLAVDQVLQIISPFVPEIRWQSNTRPLFLWFYIFALQALGQCFFVFNKRSHT